jgi:hypothetical protein
MVSGVLGVSLGAASSTFIAADDPDIGAVVEDSGYAGLYPLMQQQWHKESGLPDILPGHFFPAHSTGKVRAEFDREGAQDTVARNCCAHGRYVQTTL